MVVIYLIGAFIALFLSCKRYSEEIEGRKKYEAIVETSGFWKIVGITLFYPIYVPLAIMWKGLDIIYNKFKKK